MLLPMTALFGKIFFFIAAFLTLKPTLSKRFSQRLVMINNSVVFCKLVLI